MALIAGCDSSLAPEPDPDSETESPLRLETELLMNASPLDEFGRELDQPIVHVPAEVVAERERQFAPLRVVSGEDGYLGTGWRCEKSRSSPVHLVRRIGR